MSMLVKQSLISARFLTTFGHFVALLTLFSTIDNNISAGLADGSSDSDRKEATDTAWVIVSIYDFLSKEYLYFYLSIY